MTRPIAAAVILLLFAAVACGQTYITSDVTTSQAWGPSGSPYIIQADIEIINDSTLTIQSGLMSGVTVAFDGDYELKTGWGSAIIAQGNPTHRVTFTSNAGTPAPYDWEDVDVNGPGTSSFEYCIFEFAEYGLNLGSTSAPVAHCEMRDCGVGLFMFISTSIVQYCDMHDCHDGVMLSGPGNDPAINYCNIYGNSSWNLYVLDFPEPAATINAENNWWGTDVEAEIASEIFDSADNPNIYATIDYDPWWMEQPVEETTWGRVKALFAR